MKRILLMVLASVLFVVGCGKHEAQAPRVDVLCMDESLQPYAEAWRVEVARRFPSALVVLCHGGSVVEGEWVALSTDHGLPATKMDDLAQHFKDLYPDRTVVLLCCDVWHYHLKVHGVYHAMDSVYCIPDRAVGENPTQERLTLGSTRWQEESGVVGNIFEFVSD